MESGLLIPHLQPYGIHLHMRLNVQLMLVILKKHFKPLSCFYILLLYLGFNLYLI